MLPELIRIPGLGLTIWTYGVLLAVGIIAGGYLAVRLGERDGLAKDKLYSLAVWAAAPAFIGAQLLGVIIDWPHSGINQQLLSFNHFHAGSSSGALLMLLGATIFLTRRLDLSLAKTLDALAPGIALASAIARLGCFAAGCCWGKPTDSWIGVRFTERAHQLNGVPVGVALVPTQLILAGAGFLVFASMLWLWKRRAFDGQIILAYLLLYSIARFAMQFLRDDPRGEVLGLSTSQLISIILFPLALASYFQMRYQCDFHRGRERSSDL